MSKQLKYYGSTTSFQNLYSDNLDGVNEHIDLVDSSLFTFGNNTGAGGTDQPFSWSIWLKPGAVAAQQMFISKRNGLPNNEYYAFVFSGRISFILENYGSAEWIGRNTPNSIVSAGTWYFICGTYSGNKSATGIKIYKNAVREDNANNNSGSYNGMGNGTAPLVLGAGSPSGGFNYNGRIYHPAMWSKELSLAEVGELYTLKGGDLRTSSCAANLIEPYHYPNGQSDYPTYTGYKQGLNGTMDNQENTDINTDIP